MKFLAWRCSTKSYGTPFMRRPLLVFGVFAVLAISVFLVWYYMQNLRVDGERLDLTFLNLAIVPCSIAVATIIAWHNSESAWWTSGIFALLFIGFFLTWSYWHDLTGDFESLGTTLPNIGPLAGGVVAVMLAVWRIRIEERQANTARQQANTTQFSALNVRYESAKQDLRSDLLSARLGGIHALQSLAEEYPEQYHVHVMQLLCAFVRSPIEIAETEPSTVGPLRNDIQDAMTAIGRRDATRIELEQQKEFHLDLRSADLRRVLLRGANLSNANLDNANLSEAILIGANLSCVQLWQTNLSSILCAEPPNGEDNADRNPVQGLTQQTLDQACADADKPPRQLFCARDAESGIPLRWYGGPC